MWHIISITLWFTCVQSYYQRPANPYGPFIEHPSAIGGNPAQTYPPSDYQRPAYGISQKPDYSGMSFQNSGSAAPSKGYPYPYNSAALGYLRSSSLREPRADLYPTADLFDVDYGSVNDGGDIAFTDPVPLIEPRNSLNTPSYYEELELTEKFGNYLKRRTRIDSSSTSITDAAHQYNALFAVLIALAKVVRNSCTEFNQVYDQIYLPTVDTYFKFGLANAERVSGMIENYIRKGNSRMPKIRKLKKEICDSELFCVLAFDNHINSSPLVYVKELETLEALAHLARSFYPYIEEFNQAAQKGAVLRYLKKSKDKIKPYIMHIVNSVEHLTDRVVKCM